MRKQTAWAGLVGGLLLSLLASSAVAGAAPPSEGPRLMPPNPRILDLLREGRIQLPVSIFDASVARSLGIDQPRRVPGRAPLSGTINALAVLVDFSDKVKTVQASFFDSLIFEAPAPGRGSVRDYYEEVSYGRVDIVTLDLPSGVGWVRAPETYAHYVNPTNSSTYGYCTDFVYPYNCQKLAEDVVDAVSSVVNFADYDNDGDRVAEPIMLVHAGQGAELTGSTNDVWSHSWSLQNPRNYDGVTISDYVIMPEYWLSVSPTNSDMTIGVFAHEMGHGFWGLPDLYDRDYSSNGIGRWSLMAGGSWNGPGQFGASPAWPDAWSRIQMGFAAPTDAPTNTLGWTLPQLPGNPAPTTTVLKVKPGTLASQEYFLIENRQRAPFSYDEYLPGGGLLIWHVDEAMLAGTNPPQNDNECTVEPHSSCSDTKHYLVALEQADGLHQLESKISSGDAGDPFPGTANRRAWTGATHPETSSYYAAGDSGVALTNISDSADPMTFDLAVTIGINDVAVTEGNLVSANFTVALSAASLETVTVDYATSDISTTPGRDFTPTSGTLTFAPRELLKTISVPILNDMLTEKVETFRVTLSNAVAARILDGEGIGTITDDDVPSVGVSIADASVLEGDAGLTAMRFTVTTSMPVPLPLNLNFTTRPGTASPLTDYAPLSAYVTIPEGQTTATISIAVRGDRFVERNEYFYVDLLPSWGFVLSGSRAVGRILNDDQGGITIGNVYSVREGRQANFVVRLTAAMQRPVTVRFATADGTAVAPKDYAAVKGLLTFAPGVTSQVVHVTTRVDALAEGRETFTLVLSAPQGASLIGSGVGTAFVRD